MLPTKNMFLIRPVTEKELNAILEVYRQCEDFLSLGPQPKASAQMVLQDIELSKGEGGIFCGIYDEQENMIGVADFVPSGFEGNPNTAFITLFMIASPFRRKGLGSKVVEWIEARILENEHIATIQSAVQENNPKALQFWQRNGYQVIRGPERQPDGTTVFRLSKECVHLKSKT
jgi:GNAT superfamily N-acetyltransferase